MDLHRSTAFSYQPCASYFVQSQDDDTKMAYLDPRERVKMLHRERQLIVAEEMSKAVSDEYQQDIMAHLDHMETLTLPDVSSMDLQPEIEWYMRPYLLDFLIEAHAAFQLLPETLFLTVNLLDRYCSRRIIYKRHYQLVGCVSLLVAAKYGDRKDRVPTIPELQAMCCSNYDNDMFEQMERHLLQTVEWTIGHPTVDVFLEIAVAEDAYDPEVEHMARYIAEMAMYHKDFVAIRASVMARAALRLARSILQRSNASEVKSEEQEDDFESFTMIELSRHLYRPSQILSRKYASSHLSSVAVLLEVFLERLARSRRPPSPPVELMPVQAQQPQTPQKAVLPSIPHGVPTPPFTPHGNAPLAGAYVSNVGNPPANLYPSTPTSIPDDIMQDDSGFDERDRDPQEGSLRPN